MGWSQVSPNRWERPLTGMERYFFFIGQVTAAKCNGREHYILSSRVTVDVNLPDVETALRHAWKQVRWEEPDIATTLEDEKKVYRVPDDAALQKWLDATFIVSGASDAEELYRAGLEFKRSTLYFLPRSRELVLFAHHSSIDGIGLVSWWHKYLTAVTNPKEKIVFGDEYTRLAPALEETLGYTAAPTLEQSKKATEIFMEYINRLPGIGPVSTVGKTPAGRCQNIEHRFSRETTTTLVKRCKAQGISVTSAIHAAYIRMLMMHPDPTSNTSRYTSVGDFNLRPYLPAPFNDVSAIDYYTVLPFTIDLPASFSQLAQSLNDYYRSSLRTNPEQVETNVYLADVLTNVIKSPEYQAAPIPPDALVSSLGIVENHLQRQYGSTVVVKDYKITVDIVLGMDMLHLYTFDDQLRLVYNFNDSYQEPAKITSYLHEMDRILREELVGSG